MTVTESQESPLLLTASLCRKLRTYTEELDKLIDCVNAIRYPCGSFEISPDHFAAFQPIWESRELNRMIASKGFRSLSPFGDEVHMLWYLEEYRATLNPQAFGIVPALVRITASREDDLDSLGVTVLFRKRLTTRQVDGFVQCIYRHFVSQERNRSHLPRSQKLILP